MKILYNNDGENFINEINKYEKIKTEQESFQKKEVSSINEIERTNLKEYHQKALKGRNVIIVTILGLICTYILRKRQNNKNLTKLIHTYEKDKISPIKREYDGECLRTIDIRIHSIFQKERRSANGTLKMESRMHLLRNVLLLANKNKKWLQGRSLLPSHLIRNSGELRQSPGEIADAIVYYTSLWNVGEGILTRLQKFYKGRQRTQSIIETEIFKNRKTIKKISNQFFCSHLKMHLTKKELQIILEALNISFNEEETFQELCLKLKGREDLSRGSLNNTLRDIFNTITDPFITSGLIYGNHNSEFLSETSSTIFGTGIVAIPSLQYKKRQKRENAQKIIKKIKSKKKLK